MLLMFKSYFLLSIQDASYIQQIHFSDSKYWRSDVVAEIHVAQLGFHNLHHQISRSFVQSLRSMHTISKYECGRQINKLYTAEMPAH